VKDGLVRGAEEKLLGKPEALGAIEDRLMASVCGNSSLNSCHQMTGRKVRRELRVIGEPSPRKGWNKEDGIDRCLTTKGRAP